MWRYSQQPDFVFRRNGRVHLNRRGGSVQSTTGSRGVRISGSNVRYTMFRGSVKSTGYLLHSPVSPSVPLPASPCAPSHFNWSLTRNVKRCVLEIPCGLLSPGTRATFLTGWVCWRLLLQYFDDVSKNRFCPKNFIFLIRFPIKFLSKIPVQVLRVAGGCGS
jgi:hypothetical protein